MSSFVKDIAASLNLYNIEKVVSAEVLRLQQELQSNFEEPKTKHDFLIRLLYCELLGFRCPFAYFKVVEFSSDDSIMVKRLAYLILAVCLSPDDDLITLVINQISRDLQRSRSLDVIYAGLSGCMTLCSPQFIPIFKAPIHSLLKHYDNTIRKKASMCIHHFIHLDPSLISDFEEDLNIILTDSDPIVATCGLYILYEIIPYKPLYYKKYTYPVVWIMNQLLDRHVDENENYYNLVPLPFTIIILLRLFSLLGKADLSTSKILYKVIHRVISFINVDSYIGVSILFEWIRTVVMIYPNLTLLNQVNKFIYILLKSSNQNIHYVAVSSLSLLIKYHKNFTYSFNKHIIKCLDENDHSVIKKSYEIFFDMCNSKNYINIMNIILKSFPTCYEVSEKQFLVQNICDCAERFAPSIHLYISTLTHLLYYNTGKIAEDVSLLIINLLHDGIGDEELNKELRTSTLDIYQKIVEDKLSKSLTTQDNAIVRLCIYLFGEYGDMFYDKEKEKEKEKIRLENKRIESSKVEYNNNNGSGVDSDIGTPKTDISIDTNTNTEITNTLFEGIEPAPLQFEPNKEKEKDDEEGEEHHSITHHHHHRHHHSKSSKSSMLSNTITNGTTTEGGEKGENEKEKDKNNEENRSQSQHQHKHRHHHHHKRRKYHNIYTYYEILCKLYKPYYNSDNTKLLIITALTKLYIKTNIKITDEDTLMNLERDLLSTNVDISHRCDLLLNLIHQNAISELVKDVENVEPSEKLNDKIDLKSDLGESVEEEVIDEELSFLNKYVEKEIKKHHKKTYQIEKKKEYDNNNGSDEYSPIKKREKKYNLVLHAYQAPTTIPSNLDYVTGVDSSGKHRYTKKVNPSDPTYEKMINTPSSSSSASTISINTFSTSSSSNKNNNNNNNNSNNSISSKLFSLSLKSSKSNSEKKKEEESKIKEVNLRRPRRNTAFSSSRNVFSLPSTPNSQDEEESSPKTDGNGNIIKNNNNIHHRHRHSFGLLSKAISSNNNPSSSADTASTPPPRPKPSFDKSTPKANQRNLPPAIPRKSKDSK